MYSYESGVIMKTKGLLYLVVSVFIVTILNSCSNTQASTMNFVSAQENAECGDSLEWKINDGVLSIDGQGDMYDFNEILRQWYDAKDEIVEIKIGNEVTSIGKNAFNGLCNVKKITIGDNVTKLGTGALSETQIATLTIPKNVREIEGNLFSAYSDTKHEITIDAQNEHFIIKDNIIYSSDMTKLVCCLDIENIAFAVPETVTEIADYAFAYQPIEEIRFSSNLKLIGEGAFKQCENLKTANFDIGIVWIGEEAFLETQIQHIAFGNSLRGIGKRAFLYCEELNSVTFGENIKFIGEESFLDCDNLKSVNLKNAEAIGRRAFYNCDNLKDVFIPETVVDIGKEAFGFRAIGGTDTTKNENFVIKCNKDSAAYAYAEENQIEATVII